MLRALVVNETKEEIELRNRRAGQEDIRSVDVTDLDPSLRDMVSD